MSQWGDKVPPICFASCNDAILEAQRVGKNPALCQPNSAKENLESCEECRQKHSGEPTSKWKDLPGLAQYLDYCNATSSTATTTASPLTTVTTNVVITTELSGHVTTVLTLQTVYPSYAPFANTALVATTATLPDGQTTVWVWTVTYTAPKSSLVDFPTTASNGAGETTPAPPPPATTQSTAWVAGPVVGGVALLAILVLLGYFWRRRRRQRALGVTAAGTAPEIDGKERLEIDGKSQKPELAGSRPDVNTQDINQHQIQELEAGAPYRGGRHQRDT
ncbi:glycoprotein X [Apiospora arundinis]|uniref:Glycoprotein X n=1 Tax=Apiospora arundinis TaxID=335852 RepID=A0ABR2HT88_9PEZI